MATPTDDTARLVYADWLQEKAEDFPNAQERRDRAEFIRLQIELASREPEERRPDLLARETELRQVMVRALGSDIARLPSAPPERITFDRGFIRNMFLFRARVATLPSELAVVGNLDLQATRVTELPSPLFVGGNLDLGGTTIRALPPNLYVGGSLNLARSKVTCLPPDLQVGHSLYLNDSGILTLPAGLQIPGNLNLRGTRITELPEGLRVGDALSLLGTRVTELPPDLRVGGNLHLDRERLTPKFAIRMSRIEGLSRASKVSALRFAGMYLLADEVAAKPSDGSPSGPGTSRRKPSR